MSATSLAASSAVVKAFVERAMRDIPLPTNLMGLSNALHSVTFKTVPIVDRHIIISNAFNANILYFLKDLIRACHCLAKT